MERSSNDKRSERCRRNLPNLFLRFPFWHRWWRCRQPRMRARRFPTGAIGRARWALPPTALSARNIARATCMLRSAGRLRPPWRWRPPRKTPGIMSADQNPRLRLREASNARPRPVGASVRCAGRSRSAGRNWQKLAGVPAGMEIPQFASQPNVILCLKRQQCRRAETSLCACFSVRPQ